MKLIIIGLDGMNYELINKNSDVMPTLYRYTQKECNGILKSTQIPVTAPAWVSFITGKKISSHGIFDFFIRRSHKEHQIKDFIISKNSVISDKDVKDISFFEILSKRGKKSLIFNMPFVDKDKAKSDIVSSWITTKSKDVRDFLSSKILEKHRELIDMEIFPEVKEADSKKEQLEKYLKFIKKRKKLLISILKKSVEYDLISFLISTSDWVQHKAFTILTGYDDDKEIRVMARKVLKEIDDLVLWIEEELGDNFNIFIISDHGFKNFEGRFFVNTWLKNKGYLKFKKKSIAGNKRDRFNLSNVIPFLIQNVPKNSILMKIMRFFHGLVSSYTRLNIEIYPEIDLNGSSAYLLSDRENMIYINERIKKNSQEYDKIVKEIKSKLEKIEGIRCFNAKEIFAGKYSEYAGDIFIISDKYQLNKMPSKEEFFIENVGDHGLEGIFLARGRDINRKKIKEKRIFDLAPTIIFMFGEDVPLEMDGEVIKEIFHEESGLYKKEVKKKRYKSEKESINGIMNSIEV